MPLDNAPKRNEILAIRNAGAVPRIGSGFRNVTAAPTSQGAPALAVYAAPHTTLAIDSDAEHDVHVYLWGLATHPNLPRQQTARWIGRQVALGDTRPLRELMGTFIALVDDRRGGAVSFVSDLLGTRHFFFSQRDDALIGSSDVWTLADLGWIAPRLNYDAIASWLRTGYDLTGGSLFAGVSGIEPGAVTTFNRQGKLVTSYTEFEGGADRHAPQEVIETIHGIMQRAIDVALRELGPVQIAMSGGFDSRYLAVLTRDLGIPLHAACFNEWPWEGEIAAEVARRLDLALEILPTDGSRWNSYDEPFHFAPTGFPISKQQTFLAASRNPGLPCLNGFLGDVLIRGCVDRLEEKLPEQSTEEPSPVYQRAQELMPKDSRFDLIAPEMLCRCDARTLSACCRLIAQFAHTANVYGSTMSLRRHPGYFGNNYTQHLAFAEPLLPFMNFDLAQYKCRTHSDCFTFETYRQLLARFYPKLADVPHGDAMVNGRSNQYRPSRITQTWARTALDAIVRRGGLRILDPRKTVPRLVSAMAGGGREDVTAMFAYRLWLLEERLRRIGIDLNWEAL